jgi:hypothetical protein
MNRRARRNHSPAFKAKVALAAVKGDRTLAQLAEHFDAVGDKLHSENRIIAQAMNFGTFDDIIVLEQTIGKKRLVEVMLRAEPGWLSDRSWEFWRGRLSPAAGGGIPAEAPRRHLCAAAP